MQRHPLPLEDPSLKFAPPSAKHFPAGHFAANSVPASSEAGSPDYNSLGYNCQEFDAPRGDINLMFLGCSWTEDYPSYCSFSKHVCDHFEADHGVRAGNWNLGLGGSGMDFIARTVLCSIDVIKPDMVFLVIPGVDRREFFAQDGRLVRFQRDWVHEAQVKSARWNGLNRITQTLMLHLAGLTSGMEDSVNLLKNYKLVEMCLNLRGIPWGFSMVPPAYVADPVLELLDAGWLDRSRYLGSPYEAVDFVSPEDCHPGRESRKLFGKKVYDWFWTAYPEQMAALCRKG